MIPLEFAFGLAFGLAIAAALYLVLWWRSRRPSIFESPPDGAFRSSEEILGGGDGVSSTGPYPAAETVLVIGREVPDVVSPLESGPGRAAGSPTVGGAGAQSEPRGPVRGIPRTEALRLSQRVILHVYAQGVLQPGEVAPLGLCQAGIVEALGIPQAGLAAVLRRLEAAGILVTERGHVKGRDRRLKIYRLSPRGLEVAREIRARSHRRPGR